VEAGVETSYLRNVGQSIENRLDRCEVVRLMQWRKRNEFVQLSQHVFSDDYGASELRTAMNDAMTHADDLRTTVMRSQPEREDIDRIATALDPTRQFFVSEFTTVGILCG